jgi:hypothetical protein
MNSTAEPQLAPPGAGLPLAELLLARLLVRLRRWTGNRDAFTAKFRLERENVRALIHRCDAGSGARRVLIDRPRGLEDSSRYWSVWMTLDHLRIIHGSIERVIGALAKGVVPKGKASTAAVKPSPAADASIVEAYKASCESLLTTVAAVPNLNTTARYAHPWFGPLNAAGWYAMAGSHLAIHRVQIERIIAGWTDH